VVGVRAGAAVAVAGDGGRVAVRVAVAGGVLVAAAVAAGVRVAVGVDVAGGVALAAGTLVTLGDRGEEPPPQAARSATAATMNHRGRSME